MGRLSALDASKPQDDLVLRQLLDVDGDPGAR